MREKTVKELWAKYAVTKNRSLLVRIGEINRAEQLKQYVKMETDRAKLSVRDR